MAKKTVKKKTQPSRKKPRSSGSTNRKKNQPEFTAKEITDDNLDLFLRVFNENHRLFAAEYVRCWNATRAYQKIYPNANYNTAKKEAHKLLQEEKIQMYLDFLAVKANEKFEFDQNSLMKDLDIVKKQAMDAVPVYGMNGKPTGKWTFNALGAINAIKLQGMEIGMFTKKIQLDDNRKDRVIIHHHVVPEIRSIDMADPKYQKDINTAVEEVMRERVKQQKNK